MRRKHASEAEEAEINLTPMLDIVFIMLIFFIVTATFVKEEGLLVSKPAEAPDEPPPQDQERRNIQMEVTEDCWVILERRRIDPGQVGPNVQRLMAERPNAPAIISVVGDAKTDCVVEVMDQVRQGGVANSAITLRKQEVYN